MKENIFIYGSGGHAKVIFDILEKAGQYKVVFFVDERPEMIGRQLFGVPIQNEAYLLSHKDEIRGGICAIGNNESRKKVTLQIEEYGFNFIKAIHPNSVIGKDVIIGNGTTVMAGTIINTSSKIGEHSIVNTGASIDHDCQLGNYTHVSPGVHVCGGVQIGSQCFLGVGANVGPNVNIADNAIIGAGVTVLKNIGIGEKIIPE